MHQHRTLELDHDGSILFETDAPYANQTLPWS
jgi:hypothetical protein